MKLSNGTKKKILNVLFLSMILAPAISFAQLTPDCNGPDCGFNDLLGLVNKIINWIIMIAIPISAGVLAWAGILYMTSGVSDKKSQAKEMIRKVLIGLVFILSAWIIVSTLLNALLNPTFKDGIPIEGFKK